MINNLSPAENKVLNLMEFGVTNYEIANELFVCVGTVRSHLNSIYRKLGFKNKSGNYKARLELISKVKRRNK